ncbi:OmpA family protein [Croceivirga thetidis]|uniref:OmpA family protein n=1 Tax=Croceivirga thetidis TaxID=2721623 RepID=A0ABX1GU23_9FLAO|nr:OmpA family protein [Croceivirga thetidis]NKI33119.1 OmpA family protein [Croceivirga thetidis]
MKLKYLFVLFITPLILLGQNLVINPSFEEFIKCPEKISNLSEDTIGWSAPTLGTTDYFNSCSDTASIPQNFVGNQAVKFGNGYVGFYLKAPNNYREYIQGELKSTLERGKKYAVSFYISLAESSKYGLNEINVLFSENQLKTNDEKFLKLKQLREEKKVMNLSSIKNYKYFLNTDDWVKLETEIVAKGTENYILIGNFHTDEHTGIRKSKGSKEVAYYYLDMVSVTQIPSEQSFEHIQMDKTYVLKDVKFATDSFELTKASKQILNRLYLRLNEEKDSFLTIQAHTDNVGAIDYNVTLSNNRAKAISEYLIAKGFPSNRIQWIGYGELKPKQTNESAAGRQENRRAEFRLSKQSFSSTVIADDDSEN